MFEKELDLLKIKGLLRDIKDRGNLDDSLKVRHSNSRVLIQGIEYINFSSNDYLGLASHPDIIKAVKKSAEYGIGTTASRLLCGGTEAHSLLERLVCQFKEREASLIFSSGYLANISAIPAIAKEGDIIFSDELNHGSIIDGCRLSKAKKIIYKHKDTEELYELIQGHPECKKIIITDTIFSMDGDIAPLNDIYNISKDTNAVLYLDDSHGTGTIGNGFGALRHFGIKPEKNIIQMGTFSKALGCYGAFIAGDKDVIDWLINTARGFIFSTALPAPLISASIKALEIVMNDKDRLIEKLWHNQNFFIEGIKETIFETLSQETPIIALILPKNDIYGLIKVSDILRTNNIYAPVIKPPSVKFPRIRITISAAHIAQDIKKLLDCLKEFKG